MLLSRSATVITLALIGLAFSHMPSMVLAQEVDADRVAKGKLVQDAPPPSCHVTLPSAGSFVPPSPVHEGPATQFGIGADGMVRRYGTERLWTLLPTDGIWRGTVPHKPSDFAYSNKLPWGGAFSDKEGPLTVTGKRLDGPAPSFTETEEISGFPHGDDHAGIMGGIDIPVFGCWEITGRYKDRELSFVIWVTPLPKRESSSRVTSSQIVQEPSAPRKKPRRIHVDGEVEAKSLVYRVTPEIPYEPQVANVSGAVVVHAVIAEDGRAHELQYVSGPPPLAQAAINAVTWWEYRVTEESVEVDTTIEVVFPPANN
jgi:Gram-negative bacterial TonB protein C-terminal